MSQSTHTHASNDGGTISIANVLGSGVATAFLASTNVFTNTQQITVPTTTLEGLILKTSDNNTTKNILEIQSSTAAILTKINPLGYLSIANATAAHSGTARFNVNDNSGAIDLIDVRWANTRVLYIDRNGAVTLTPTSTQSQTALSLIPSVISAASATVTWYGIKHQTGFTGISAGNHALFGNYYSTSITVTSVSDSSTNVYLHYGLITAGSSFSSTIGSFTGYAVATDIPGNTGTIQNLYYHDIAIPLTVKGTIVITNAYGIRIRDINYGATLNYSIYTNAATNGARFGHQLVIDGSTDVNQLKATGFTTQTLPVGYLIDNTAATNVIRNVLQLETQSTGTAANGLGAGLLFSLETATASTMQNAGRIYAVAVDNTNATRKYDLVATAFDTAEREGIRIRADGTRSLVGIDTAAPTARLHLPAGGTAANTAPLKFTTQAAALTSVEQGTMELVGNSLQFTQLAKRRGVVMSQSTMTADFTLVSSAAESATIITAEHGANYLEVGKMEEIRLYGTLQKNVGAPTNTLTIRTKYAGATIHTIVSSNAAIAANTQVEIIITITCRTTGATGTLQINSIVRIDGDIITPAAPSLVTVNTTAAEDTTITAQFTNSSATNNLVIHQGRVLCIEPNR